MKNTSRRTESAITAVLLSVGVFVLTGCSTTPNSKLARYEEAEEIGKGHLATFDTLDFDVYTNQRWERFPESHAADILVHYPDGHTTKGLPAHIEELKQPKLHETNRPCAMTEARNETGLAQWRK